MTLRKGKSTPSKGRALYLLDANVLIRAHEDYYDIDRIPQFWEWLIVQGEDDRIKIPFEIHGEIESATGPLGNWIRAKQTKDALILDSHVDRKLAREVIDSGYAPDLDEDEVDAIGQDPFLIAHALAEPQIRIVVTKETSKPRATRANRKVPDVCDSLGVRWTTDFALFRDLDFRTCCPAKPPDLHRQAHGLSSTPAERPPR